MKFRSSRHGKFKGAVEPFLLDKLSEENKEQIKDYVGSIWNHVVSKISEDQEIFLQNSLTSWLISLQDIWHQVLLKISLLTDLFIAMHLYDTLKILSGLTTDDKINLVSMTKYAKVPDPQKTVSS